MIELKFSDKDVPFIDMGEYGRLSFSSITSHPTKGYKYVCFSRHYEDNIRIKKKVRGELVERFVSTSGRDATTLDMNLQRSVGRVKKGFHRGMIPQRLGEWLRKKLKPYLVNGYFPYNRLGDLKLFLAKQDVEEILSKPQRKRINKK